MNRNTVLALGIALALTGCDVVDQRVVLAGVIDLSATEPDPNAAPVRRVWANAGSYASPSPDGRYIAFVDWSTGDVAMHDLTTGEDQLLTRKGSWSEDGSWAEVPLFSPDGRQVVYSFGNVLGEGDLFQYELRVVAVGDTTQRVLHALTPDDNWIVATDWSTSQGILVEVYRAPERGAATDLAVVDPATGALRVLRTFSRDEEAPSDGAFSPDGRFVAYRQARDLRIIGSDGTRDGSLGLEVRFVLGWSRDGAAILVHASGQSTTGIWSVPVTNGRQGGEPQLVRGGMAAFLPGGFAGRSYYYGVPVDAPRLFTTSVDVPSGRVLSPPSAITSPLDGMAGLPAWSPDGRTLAYGLLSAVDRDVRIMVRTANGDEVREVTTMSSQCRPTKIVWAPDGQSLLVQGQTREGRSLFRVNVRSGDVQEVFTDMGFSMAVMPDGRIVYLKVAPGGQGTGSLTVRDLSTGQERAIAEGITPWPDIWVSPDGRQVALLLAPHEGTTRIVVLPADGGPMREVGRAEHPLHFDGQAFNAGQWTPDGQYVLAVRGEWEREGSHELLALPIGGGAPIRVMDVPPGERGHILHPDGRRVAYQGGEERTELWVLDDLTVGGQ